MIIGPASREAPPTSEALAPDLRREWSRLRELPKDELTLDAIQRLIALEKLRGSRGA
jgi:hypothetical protein